MHTATKLQLPNLGFGCGFRLASKANLWQDMASILNSAIAGGIRFFDTAEVYGEGLSEELLGSVVSASPLRDEIAIATKVSPEHLSAPLLTKSVEASLRRLKREQLDLLQVHWSNPAIDFTETLPALGNLIAAGKIKEVGVCNFALHELKSAEAAFSPHKISSVQVEYNLLDRSIEHDLLPYCRETNKMVIGYSPLCQGVIPGGESKKGRITEIATELDVPISALILHWVKAFAGVVPIPNTMRDYRLTEYLTALTLDAPSEYLDRISQLFPYSPIEIEPHNIAVGGDGVWRKPVFTSLEEAIANPMGLRPSPQELAEQMQRGHLLKPIRVQHIEGDATKQYRLVEGVSRYWAWVIAFGWDKPVLALPRN